MPKIKGQENQRQPDIWVDQHNRSYFANIELASGDPIDLTPQYTAPHAPSWAKGLLVPPLDDREVCQFVPRMERHKSRFQLKIDYLAWLRKHDALMGVYRERIATIAQNMKGANVLEEVRKPSPELMQYVGPPPFPPREFIQAMAAGNAWALGLSDEVPEKAQALLDELRPHLERQRISPPDEQEMVVDPFATEGADYMDLGEDEQEPQVPDPFASSTQATTVVRPVRGKGR